MTIKRKPKPMPPKKPIELERTTVNRHRNISPGTRDEVIQQLQKFPVNANIVFDSVLDGCHNDIYSVGRATAVYPEPESDQEFQRRMDLYQEQLQQYEKDRAKYERQLAKWQVWHQENKAAIRAEEDAAKAAKIAVLEEEAQVIQKRLDAAKKRLEA